MSDQELIEGIIRRDRAALQFLVDTYQRQVIKTAYYLVGDMAEAEDISQDTMMEVVRSISKFKGRSALSTWIYRITVNRSLNAVKRNKRRDLFTRIETFFSGSGTVDRNVEDAFIQHDNPVEKNENSAILYHAISMLTENQRIAFTLHKFEDLPYQEIASVMQVSLSSVESLIHRAKMNLQKRLTHNFPEYAK
jgi:RNA polymerase sigma-70 factor, ECF subfamily